MRGPVITPDMVQSIRKLLAEDLSQRAVAETLGISRASVKKYKAEEAVDRRKAVAARSNQAYRQRKRDERRNTPPPDHQAIRTASPIVRELFEEMWRQGIKQHEIAKRVGVSTNIMTRWKKGECAPSMFSVQALAVVLGYEIVLRKRDV